MASLARATGFSRAAENNNADQQGQTTAKTKTLRRKKQRPPRQQWTGHRKPTPWEIRSACRATLALSRTVSKLSSGSPRYECQSIPFFRAYVIREFIKKGPSARADRFDWTVRGRCT